MLRFKFLFYLIHNFKIDAQSSGGVETAHLPLAGATNAQFLHKTESTI